MNKATDIVVTMNFVDERHLKPHGTFWIVEAGMVVDMVITGGVWDRASTVTGQEHVRTVG